MDFELVKLLCAILTLFGTISYVSGSAYCMFYPAKGLNARGYYYSVATSCGLFSNCVMFYVLWRTNQKYMERGILIIGGIFAFSGAVDTIEKNFLSEVVQIMLMLGGLINVFAYSILLLRSKVIMKRIVQFVAFFWMIGGGLIALSAMLLTKSREYFTLAQIMHLTATSCYFTGAVLNLLNQSRVYQGYPEYGTKQYIKMMLLGKRPLKMLKEEDLRMIEMVEIRHDSVNDKEIKEEFLVQEIEIETTCDTPSGSLQRDSNVMTMRTHKAVTELPKYRSIVDRNSFRNSINPRQSVQANKPSRMTLDTRYMANPPADEGFYA